MATEIVISSIRQVGTSSNGAIADVQIAYQINGILPDFVQIYAVNAAAADASVVGASNFVQNVDVSPPEISYDQQIQLAAGTIYTIFLCPRTGSQDAPNIDIDGEYWDNSCVSTTFTTTTSGPPPGTGLVPPVITSVVPQPAKVNMGNSVTIAWSTPTSYQQFQIWWTVDGEALAQGNTAADSWTAQTAPGHHYTFAVQGGVYRGISGTYNWSAWGPTVSVTPAENLRSLRTFLQTSGIVPVGGSLRSVMPAADTLRKFMQL
jgi:hypothetical protein